MPELIPVGRPLLPTHGAILPYLRDIDDNRFYSNFGPLVRQLEERLSRVFELPKECVATMSNGTAAITNTLRTYGFPKGSICLVPSWTFMATVAAVVAAGMTPYFIDVDEDTWTFAPEDIQQHLQTLDHLVKAVVVVSPFGAPINRVAWDAFTEETGIKVVIDAAAGFDAVSRIPEAGPGKTPIIISLHATKPFGIGEGGLVLSTDAALVEYVGWMSNFGFTASRVIHVPGTNAKMSEYTAAVGLAALDQWDATRQEWFDAAHAYKVVLDQHQIKHFLSDHWVSSVCNVRLPYGDVDTVMNMLQTSGIGTRKWWLGGCHRHPAYQKYRQVPLPVTERLGDSVMGIPFMRDMTLAEMQRVAEVLSDILRKQGGEVAA